MARHSKGAYPANWEQLAAAVKQAAGWCCVRCGHAHDPAAGYTLTVHHLDMNPANNAWWNLLALCQRCHLHVQGRVIVERPWMFEHSAWFLPYVAGYYAHINGWDESREHVMQHVEKLAALGVRSTGEQL